MRTRSPCLTTSGVMYGAARPLSVKRLNSIDIVLGTVDPGRMAHSWMIEGEVAIDRRGVGRLGVDDEQAHHPHALLHGDVRVVEERAVLVEGELVGERFRRA